VGVGDEFIGSSMPVKPVAQRRSRLNICQQGMRLALILAVFAAR